jgi:hypothetical protein
MKTREMALESARRSANREGIPYMISRRPNGQWMYGRLTWYTGEGSAIHDKDSFKEQIDPEGSVQTGEQLFRSWAQSQMGGALTPELIEYTDMVYSQAVKCFIEASKKPIASIESV